MKKVTSKSLSEDDSLVDFLQTYAPSPPSEVKPCEELIMRSISLTTISDNSTHEKKRDRHPLRWLLPIALISAMVTLSSQLLKNNQPSPQMLSNYDDIDTFMINTWQGSIFDEPEEESLYMSGSY